MLVGGYCEAGVAGVALVALVALGGAFFKAGGCD